MIPEYGNTSLAGLKVLVVEDDPLVLLDTAHVLTRAGAIVAVALTAKVALNLIEQGGIDCAVLDFRLESGTAAAVADRLTAGARVRLLYRLNCGSAASASGSHDPA